MKRSRNPEQEQDTPAGQQIVPDQPTGQRTGFKSRSHLVEDQVSRGSTTQAHLIPTDNPRHRSPGIELVDDATDAEGQLVAAPGVRQTRHVRELQKLSFREVQHQEPFVRGEYFVGFLHQNLELIESMPLLEAYTFITIVGNRCNFTYEHLAEVLSKYQREHQRVVTVFQILIPLYETAATLFNEGSMDLRLLQIEQQLVSLFQIPQLRSRGIKLQILEIARDLFALKGVHIAKFKRKML